MPAFMGVEGMPYWIELLTTAPEKTRQFYSTIFDWGFTPVAENYNMATAHGLPVAGIVDVSHAGDAVPTDVWLTFFLTEDAESAAHRIPELGGKVLTQPLSGEKGLTLGGIDPAGAFFGLIEPQGMERFIAAGEPGTAVWYEHTAATKHAQSIEFYSELLSWDISTVENGHGMSYTTAMQDGAPFAGFFNAHDGSEDEKQASFWQVFLGVEHLDEAVNDATALGGHVRVPPQHTEFGYMAIVTDSVGTLLTVVEVEPPPTEQEFYDDGMSLHSVGVHSLDVVENLKENRL